MPFTASQLGEVPVDAGGPSGRVYDVELPYRRLGRCRMSTLVEPEVGIRLTDVAAALSAYEARHGKAATASQLLGAGVDLGSEDAPVSTT